MSFREMSNDELQATYQAAARVVGQWGATVESAKVDKRPIPKPPRDVDEAQEVFDACAAEWTARGLRYRGDVG